MQTFGETLQHYRTRRALSVAALASAVGCDRSVLQRLETERADPLNQRRDDRPPDMIPRDLVIRFGFALQLALDEVDDLLVAAGYAPLWAQRQRTASRKSTKRRANCSGV
jgi:hypothetical protein